MPTAPRIVRNRDLAPAWTVLRAREPGFQRSLITWMGGPDGYINTNPGVAIESRHCAVGLMDMPVGNRQPGVHTHTIDEIYVILEGQCESFDGIGNTHIAGPYDCLYIPKGVPHGVRTIGTQDLKLLWVNDDIERWGVSVYAEGPGWSEVAVAHDARCGGHERSIPYQQGPDRFGPTPRQSFDAARALLTSWRASSGPA